jgi:hypothetical protein
VNLYRGGTNQLRTDDAIVSDIGSGTGYPLSGYCAGNGAGLFASSAADYVRVVIDAETANADAQLAFMEAGVTRWTIGNHGGGSDVFTFRSSAGEFTDADILRLVSTGVLALEYNVNPEFSVRANNADAWAMCSFGTNRGNRSAYIVAYGSSHGIQPDELCLKNLYGPITFHPGDAGSSSEQMSLDNSGNVVAQGYVNAVGGFKDNGKAGIDTTFTNGDGDTVTVSGGIITGVA